VARTKRVGRASVAPNADANSMNLRLDKVIEEFEDLVNRFDYQFHYVVAHSKAVALVQASAAVGGPKNYRVYVVFLTPIKRGAEKLRSDSSAANLFLNIEVRQVRVVFSFGSGIRNLFDELNPYSAD
jgi:hypothetical protein